jgi:hypothetical protein
MAIGMKVMVTKNVKTDLDVTNGSQVQIVDIVLHLDEPPVGDDPIATLKYFPAYILVKLNRTQTTPLDTLDEGVIPVQVATCSFQIKVHGNGGTYITHTVCHHQYPMTAAYGFMDYWSQGQTIPYLLLTSLLCQVGL